MKEKRINEAKGVILVAIGLMIFVSLVSFNRLDLAFYTSVPNTPANNFLGIFGAYLGGILIFLFGRVSSFLIPVLILLLGVWLFRQRMPYLSIPRLIGLFVLLVSLSSLVAMLGFSAEGTRFYYAGFFGTYSANFITAYFSRLGGFIIFCTFIVLSLALVTEMLISSLFKAVGEKTKSVFGVFSFSSKKPREIPIKTKAALNGKNKPNEKVSTGAPTINLGVKNKPFVDSSVEPPLVKPKIQIKAKPVETEVKVKPQEIKIGDYRTPSLDFLSSPPPFEARKIEENLEASARILEETLEDFGIVAKVTDIERGPVITRYELEPAPGVKLNRIVALGDDIALAMKAQSVRIIAPIPGKARVGVEVPNMQSSFVYLKEILAADIFQEADSKLTLALGKDITGQPVVADLEDMPHLLIAGTTGSGKTVCVNTLILSLLFRAAPHELKFVMIDPKMVELMPYNELPHMLCPVVTESKKASAVLKWVVNEMEDRYRLLAKAAARNIESYNEKQSKEERIPYIVVIIDEFADLMSVARDEIENAVTRLAQLSRAVGIHLVLATQRPSVNVITGVIKANLPARISFKVASKVDSRTVLDMNGADKLLGKGDMLFLRPGESKLIRVQGALVSDAEIQKTVDFIKTQGEPVYDEDILKDHQGAALVNGEKDELYDEAVRIVMESNQASVSILQRRMRLGYTRAARIIDMMEQEGMVGPFEGSKPRRILVDREVWLQKVIAGEDKQT